MDALQGETFALTSTVEPLTVSAILDYQLLVHVVADSKFLTLLFDATHPKITDSQTALQAGLWANFPTFSPLALQRVMRQDYLWQADCFECFIAKDSQADSPYLEVNLATNGEFNIYYFDSYRTPNALPPRRLPIKALHKIPSLRLCFGVLQVQCSLPMYEPYSSNMRLALVLFVSV